MATLARLDAAVRDFAPATVVSLGDGFHDRQGAALLSPAAFDALAGIMAGTRWIWVTGNHDPAPPAALGGAVVPELMLAGLVLRHVPARDHGAEVAGHMHPKARIAGRRLKVSRPCFATDGTRLVMPAFGALTGGLNALDPAMTALFVGGFDAWLTGERKVHRVPHGQLVPEPPMYRTALAAAGDGG
jgi:DNA ligase-associated metallophosphoesterase